MTKHSPSLLAVLLAVLAVLSVVGPAVAAPASNQSSSSVRDADLSIREPHYEDQNVEQKRTGDGRVYVVQGPVQWIQPRNFDSENVVSVDVEQENASIEWSERTREWRLDSHGTSGTYTVTWTVRETVGPRANTTTTNNTETNTNTTATNTTTTNSSAENSTTPGVVTREYRAHIRVEHAERVHPPSSEFEQTQSDAANWDQHIVQPLEDFGIQSEEAMIALVEDRGIPWIKFTEQPTSAFTGTLLALATILVFSPGGWAILAFGVGLPLTVIIVLAVKLKQSRAKLSEADSFERARARVEQELAKRTLSQEDYTEGPELPERFAVPLREALGRNLWSGVQRIAAALTPAALKQLYLGAAIETEDYVVDVHRTDDGDVDRAAVHRSSDAPEPADDVDRIALGDAEPEVYGALALDDVPEQPLREGVSVTRLPNVPGSEYETLDELMEAHARETGVDLEHAFDGDIGRYSEVLADVLDYVASTDYVESDGSADPTRVVLNALHQMMAVASEQYQAQYFSRYRDALLYASEHLTPEERLTRKMENVQQDGIDTGIRGEDTEWEYAPDGGGDQG